MTFFLLILASALQPKFPPFNSQWPSVVPADVVVLIVHILFLFTSYFFSMTISFIHSHTFLSNHHHGLFRVANHFTKVNKLRDQGFTMSFITITFCSFYSDFSCRFTATSAWLVNAKYINFEETLF